ncbi:hypothetical protein AMTR_s00048p00094230 [Amborella trichopoda]|uniref:Uncharacterized protein n=1 Tax=Amborella trichopoda TaxID=13333 RepID=U5D2C3_AMBTC|nr:hypothetical protein AMTR_s00048p00094230 [Amborella trichopoda]
MSLIHQKTYCNLRTRNNKKVVLAHEPQYIMRPRGYENQLVSAVQASTIMLAEPVTLRHKRYLEVYNSINNAFEMLSRFMYVNMVDIEARMEILHQVNDKAV